MPRAAFLALAALAACGTVTSPESPGLEALHIVEGAEPPVARAVFDAYPESLFSAATLACDGPGQSTIRPSRDSIRCEALPPPDDAALLILEFEGTVEDLPRYVISFEGAESPAGYVVAADSYIRVPGHSGETKLLKAEDPRSGELLADILRAAGGRPL